MIHFVTFHILKGISSSVYFGMNDKKSCVVIPSVAFFYDVIKCSEKKLIIMKRSEIKINFDTIVIFF